MPLVGSWGSLSVRVCLASGTGLSWLTEALGSISWAQLPSVLPFQKSNISAALSLFFGGGGGGALMPQVPRDVPALGVPMKSSKSLLLHWTSA